RVAAAQKPLPEPPQNVQARLVLGDDFFAGRGPSVEIPQGNNAGGPSGFAPGPVTPSDVFAERIDIVLGLAEHDPQHEFALGRVLEGVGRETQIKQLAGVEEVEYLAAVDGIARQPVGVPGKNTARLAARDA